MNAADQLNQPTHTAIGERGASVIWVAFTLVLMFQFISLAIDLGLGFSEKRRMHIATDAAALAAVQQYIIDPNTKQNVTLAEATVIPEAELIAAQNGLSAAELTAGGGVELGLWDPGTKVFSPGTTPFNAVKVSARRTLSTFFGTFLGKSSLNPGVISIARVASPSKANCLVPWGVTEDELEGKLWGDVLDVQNSAPGNWGKIDIGEPLPSSDAINSSSKPVFVPAFINGLCQYEVEIGDKFLPGTGFAGLKDGFDGRLATDPIITIPVVNEFPNGNSDYVEIVGFIVVEILGQGKSGKNWNGEVRLISGSTGSGSGGPDDEPYASTRVLVF